MSDQVIGERGANWDLIAQWNEGIREEFFDGQWAGRPVYLDLEDDVIERIARRAGADSEDPESALAELLRPTLNTEPGTPPLLDRHVARTLSWRNRGAEGTPPFLAILAFLSLVAEGMRSDGEFRASNYYGRFCRAFDLDYEESSVKAKVANGFKDATPILWGALNGWLDGNEGRLGLPTAYAFDYRVYVGPPLSQALVRDADRRLLPEMFSAYRLRPGQVISRSDMARLLGDWIGGSRMSVGLKRLLEKGADIANRVADVACIELHAWDGKLDDIVETRPREATLVLTGQLRRQPRKRLYLDVAIERGLGLPSGPFRLAESASEHAAVALELLGGALEILEPDAHGWRAVANSGEIALGDLLLANLTLTKEDASLRRSARRLIVLEYDEELRHYVEVSRAQLGTTNLLLCHMSLVDELEEALALIARPTPVAAGPGELQGVPNGWIAFQNVELLTISDTENVDLMPLVPISWTQVSLGGGFPLPGRLTWLAESPPEIRASSAEGEELLVRLSCERPLNGEHPEDKDLATIPGAGVVWFPPSPDGDYRISLTDAHHPKAAVLASALVRLRSAEKPRPVVSEDEPAIGHHIADPLGPISASPQGSKPEVDGAAVLGANVVPGGQAGGHRGSLPPPSLIVHGASDANQENDVQTQVSEVRGGEVPACLLGIGHHFVLPYYGPEGPQGARIEGTCKECGLEKDWPSRPRRKKRAVKNAPPVLRGDLHAGPAPTVVSPIADEEPANWDRLMQALCFAQRGSWSSFDAMASMVDDSPWFPLEASRLLSSLGHLNVALHPRTLRVARWSISPATIAVTGEGTGVLVGYRSQSLLEALAEDIEILDGRLVVDAQPQGPALARIEGLDQEGFQELVASSETTLDQPLLLSAQPAELIARMLPPLDNLVPDLHRLERPPACPVESFDFATGSWTRIDEVTGPGAYRFIERPLRYCALPSEDGSLLLADNRLAKWLGARDQRTGLLAYEERSEVLVCPLGAQLPGLYERAAVLASGCSPTPRSDGSVAYSEVSAELAELLYGALCPTAAVAQA